MLLQIASYRTITVFHVDADDEVNALAELPGGRLASGSRDGNGCMIFSASGESTGELEARIARQVSLSKTSEPGSAHRICSPRNSAWSVIAAKSSGRSICT